MDGRAADSIRMKSGPFLGLVLEITLSEARLQPGAPNPVKEVLGSRYRQWRGPALP